MWRWHYTQRIPRRRRIPSYSHHSTVSSLVSPYHFHLHQSALFRPLPNNKYTFNNNSNNNKMSSVVLSFFVVICT